jgi:hypothetical protein
MVSYKEWTEYLNRKTKAGALGDDVLGRLLRIDTRLCVGVPV